MPRGSPSIAGGRSSAAADGDRGTGAKTEDDEAGIRISMDGRGRWIDTVFIERLWRSLKDKDVYLKGYAARRDAHAGIADVAQDLAPRGA